MGLGKVVEYGNGKILTCPTKYKKSYWSASLEDNIEQRRWQSYNGRLYTGYTQTSSPKSSSSDVKVIFGDLMLRSTTLKSDHKLGSKIVIFFDGSGKTLYKNDIEPLISVLPHWPSDAEYQTFWDAVEDLY